MLDATTAKRNQEQIELVKFYAGEIMKCKQSIFYFLNNYAKICDMAEPEPIKLYEFQKSFIKTFLHDKYSIVLGSRQTGKTRSTQLMCIWLLIFFPGYKIMHINRTIENACTNLREIKQMMAALPKWMVPEYGLKNLDSHIMLKNDSEFKCESGGANVSSTKAESAGSGRGLRPFLLWVDESAFVNLEKLSESVIPTTSKIHIKCKQNNIPYGILFTSTPNGTTGKGEYFFKLWCDAIGGSGIYKPIKMHWSQVPDYDAEWYESAKARLRYNERKINQEYELKFLGGEGTWLPDSLIKQLNGIPHKKEFSSGNTGNKIIRIFEDYKFECKYLIGVDTATAYGSDFSTIVVMEYHTFKQVAEFKGKLSVTEFIDVIKDTIDLYPNSILIPESNSVGTQVVEGFMLSEKYKNHLYYPMDKDGKIKYGFATTSKTRQPLFNAIFDYLTDDVSVVKSEMLTLELTSLVETKPGRIEANIGFHDDLVMAFGFCCYVRMYDNHLAKLFNRLNINNSKDIQNINSAFTKANLPDMENDKVSMIIAERERKMAQMDNSKSTSVDAFAFINIKKVSEDKSMFNSKRDKLKVVNTETAPGEKPKSKIDEMMELFKKQNPELEQPKVEEKNQHNDNTKIDDIFKQ